MACVVYGVMRAKECEHGVEYDGLCALVREVPDGAALRVRRRALFAHSDVLQDAIGRGPVLPLRFGAVFPDAEAVRTDLLAANLDVFTARLDALEGKAEFQLKATFDSERVLESIIASDKTVADVALRVRAVPGAAGHFDRIRLGELIAERIEQRAATAEDDVVVALQPFVVALERGKRHHEWMAANLACLVELARRGEFDAAVDRLADEHGAELHLKLVGPLAPHSFAEQQWEAGPTWV